MAALKKDDIASTMQLMEDPRDFIGDGFFCVKRSKKDKDSHAFYYRPKGKSRKVIRDDDGIVVRPQHVNGGSVKFSEVKARAEALANGYVPEPLSVSTQVVEVEVEVEEEIEGTLLFKLTTDFTKHARASKDFWMTLGLFAYDWMMEPAAAITKEKVIARVESIIAGEHPHPFFDKSICGVRVEDMTDEQKARRDDLLKSAAKFKLGLPRQQFSGTPKQADKFCRYLRAVLITGDDFTKESNPVTEAEPHEIIRLKAGKAALKETRPAVCMLKDEIAGVFSFTRQECRERLNEKALSEMLDVLVWRSVLCWRFALLTGYRVSDLANLHDGNIDGDDLSKSADEVAKGDEGHSIPITRQMREIMDEARAMRDGDEAILRKRFGWNALDLQALRTERKSYEKHGQGCDLIFPNFKNWKQQSQPSQLLRPARSRFIHEGIFQNAGRHVTRKRKLAPSHPKAHDTRSTFITFAYECGLDIMQVSEYTNHTLPASVRTTAQRYLSTTEKGIAQYAEGMQAISDALTGTQATSAKKGKLRAVK